MRTIRFLRNLLGDNRAISAVEYGILVGVIGVGLIAVMSTLGDTIETYVTQATDELTEAAGPVE